MENKNKPELRQQPDQDGITINVGRSSPRDDERQQLPTEDKRHPDTSRSNEKGSDQRTPTQAELRAAELEEIDNTEISEEHTTTSLYRRAVSDFDPKETEPQLAEHYVYRDDEFERDGYF